MLTKADIIEIVEDLNTSLPHFKTTYEKAYEKLQKAQKLGIEEIEKSKKGRAPNFIKEVDKQLRALDIVIKKEYNKHVDLLKVIDEAIKKTSKSYVYAKRSDATVDKIKEKLENLIPLLSNVYEGSDYLIRRIEHSKGYVLAKQIELVEAGLSYNPNKTLLGLEISNMVPDLTISTKTLLAIVSRSSVSSKFL
jgi:hypothetical protein